MSELRIIISTISDQAEAARIARALVDGRYAACVNILPGVQSVYRWEGVVHDEGEVMMLIKTTTEALDSTIGRLRELHPYEVPEIVVLNPDTVDPAYSSWVIEAIR